MTRRDDRTVLCVDPDDATAAAFEERPGFAAVAAATIESARDAADFRDVDCVVAAYELADGTAFGLFETVRERAPNAGCVLFTPRGTPRSAPARSGTQSRSTSRKAGATPKRGWSRPSR